MSQYYRIKTQYRQQKHVEQSYGVLRMCSRKAQRQARVEKPTPASSSDVFVFGRTKSLRSIRFMDKSSWQQMRITCSIDIGKDSVVLGCRRGNVVKYTEHRMSSIAWLINVSAA